MMVSLFMILGAIGLFMGLIFMILGAIDWASNFILGG